MIKLLQVFPEIRDAQSADYRLGRFELRQIALPVGAEFVRHDRPWRMDVRVPTML